MYHNLKVKSLLSLSVMQPMIKSNIRLSLFTVKISLIFSKFNLAKRSLVCELKSV